MRRSDADGHSAHSVPFYVPGESNDPRRWQRDSVRYASSGRQVRNTQGRRSSSSALPSPPAVKPVRVGLLAGLAFLLICIAALVGFVMTSNSGGASSRGTSSERVLMTAGTAITELESLRDIGLSSESNSSAALTYSLDPNDLLAIPGTSEVAAVNLENDPSSTKSCQFNLSDIQAAVAEIEKEGACGFVFVDVNTGHGVVYNADETMYVASSAKAPFVFWLLTSGIELDEWEAQEAEWAITDSDNESFEDLFFRHYANGYEDYMLGHDVNHDSYYYDFYPKMGARNLASIWADILLYIQGGSDEALTLGSYFASTETSFIRDGLSGADAFVLNKAGWINEPAFYYDEEEEEYNGSENDYCSVSDAAIIQADDRVYLMAIATSQPDSYSNEANVSTLARALFNVRDKM